MLEHEPIEHEVKITLHFWASDYDRTCENVNDLARWLHESITRTLADHEGPAPTAVSVKIEHVDD